MSNFAAKMHNAIRGTKRSALWFFASCMIAVVASTTLAHAAFNKQLNYQGKLTNASNVAVANGTYNMEFKLYTVSSGGVAIWTETRTGADKVQVTNGLFSVLLGEVNSLTGVDFNQTLYLGVNIGGTGTPSWDGEMTPRKKLGAVPAAIEAENLGGASASQYLRSDIAATSSVTDNTNAAFTIAQLGTGNIFDVFDGATKVLTVLDGGNVGIGDTTPAALFTVGNGDLFQVDSSGAITATAGVTTSGHMILKPFGTSAGQTTETRFLELAANGTEYAGFKAPDSLVSSIVWTLPTSDSSGCVQSDGSGHLLIASCLAGGGGGTVTSFSAGSLSPLFTTSVSTPTTTPALGFTLSNAAANTWFGNNTGSSAAPAYNAAGTLSKTDDTNVTLTLGGTPAGSLLNSVSITAGWSGQLAVGRGGTGAGTLTANGVLYGNGTSAIGATAAGTNGQILVGVTGGAPAFVSLSGDAAITNTGVLTIGANAVTYAKFQQVAASSIVGNPTGSLANAQGITLGAGLAFSGTSLVTSSIPNSSLQNSTITLAIGTTGADVGWGASSVALGGTATLNIPDAGSSARGVVTTGAQTFAGVKTLSSAPIFSSVTDAAGNFLTLNTGTGLVQKRTAAEVLSDIGALSSSTSATQTGYFGDIKLQDDTTPSNYLSITDAENLTADHTLSLNVNNADRTVSLSGNLTVSSAATISGTNTGDVTVTTIGSTPNANGLSLSGQQLQLQPANGSFGGIVSTTTQTFAGDKTFNGNVGIGGSPSHKFEVAGFNTTDSQVKIGSLEIQPFTLNNTFLAENTYYDGTKFVYRSSGSAGLFYFQGAEGQFRFATSGIAGGDTGLQTKAQFKVNADGTVALGGSISPSPGSYTGASFLINSSGNVGVGDISPAALFTVGSGDLFQVNSAGAIAAATGITTSGNVTLSTAPTASAGTYDIITRNTSTGVIEKVASNTYLTGNQTITLSGDVSGSGTTAITTTIGSNIVTYAKFQQVAASSIVGNPTGSLANAQGITLGAGLAFSGTSLVTSSIPNSSLQNSTIALMLGTSGTDANVSGSPASLGGTLTLNIPDASATARGLVTTGSQTLAGIKTFSTSIVVGSIPFINNGTGSLSLGAATPAVTGSFFAGTLAGNNADYANNSVFIGNDAGDGALYGAESVYIGHGAGAGVTYNAYNTYIGKDAGSSAYGDSGLFLGVGAGSGSGANYGIILGYNAGTNSSGDYQTIIGYGAGAGAYNITSANFIGTSAGVNAANANDSNFIGSSAGNGAANAAYSNLIGYHAGMAFTGNNIGSNNIVIGTNISLPDTVTDSINIGGILFGSGAYSTTSGDPSIDAVSTGKIGIGVVTPSYRLDVLDGNTGQVANNRVFNVSNNGADFDTTAGALSSYGGYFSSTATRSAGTNALTNVGLYTEASGAQNNYGLIVGSGSVGIGTSAPVDPLQVNGAFRISGSASARTALASSVTYDYVSSGSYARIESWGGNSSTRGGLVFRQSASDGTLGQEPFSIDSAGKTTFGTGTTATQLVVNGGNASSTAGQLLLTNGSGQALYTGVGNGGGFMYITNQDLTYWANGVGNINLTASGGSINLTGNLLPATSDTVQLGSTTKMFSDLFLASGGVVNFNNGDVTLTHSADTLTLAGGTFVTPTLTVSGLTTGRIPFATTGGQLTDSSALSWNNSTNILSINAGAGGAGEFIYTGSSTTTGLQIQSADINTNAFLRMDDTASGGYMSFGGAASVDFLPTVTFKPGATYPYGLMLVQSNDTGSQAAFTIDSRLSTGPLTTQPIFGIQTYGGTPALQVNADSTTWFNAAVLPRTSDGAALGSTSKMWSDLFLASGSVVNFNNGDVTLTHSADAITLAGGNLTISNLATGGTAPTTTGTTRMVITDGNGQLSFASAPVPTGTNTGDVTLAAVGSSPNANGASLTGQVLNLQPADGTNPGVLTAGTQTIGGAKTFTGPIAQSPGAAANLSNYLLTNQANSANTTMLNPGILVYNDGHPWGMDLGYNNGRYRTRLFASDIGDVALSYVTGTNPTGQSNFTDALVVRGDSGGAGFVGINVLSPSSRLDVANDVTGLAVNTKVANFSNGSSTFNTTAGALTSYTGYFSSMSTRSAGTNALTNVGLYATASGAQNNYAAIFNQGNVGIGTTTPDQPLVVEGQSGSYRTGLKIDTSSYVYGPTLVGYTTLNSDNILRWQGALMAANDQLLTFGDASNFNMKYDSGAGLFRLTDSAANRFMTLTDQGTTADIDFNNGKFFLKNNGNVGIGTTSPGDLLTVDTSASNRAMIGDIGLAGFGGTLAVGNGGMRYASGSYTSLVDVTDMGTVSIGDAAVDLNGTLVQVSDMLGNISLNATNGFLFTGGNMSVSALDTDNTAPATTGTTKMVITDANGQLSFANIPAGGSTTLNSIIAATGTNTINNAAYAQEWQWNSLTTGTGMKLSSTSVSSGALLDLTVNSTAAASDSQKALNISTSGTNSTTGMTTYGAYVSNSHAGTSSTNVAMYLSATGGTANRALVVPSGGGRVGIGTVSPAYLMDVVESSTGFAPAINIANSDTSTTSYAQIAFTGSGRTFGVGVGNSTETTNSLANKFFIYDSTSNAVRFVVDTGGSVGIGDATPNSLLTVGFNDAFQVNSSGQVTNGSITSTFGSINIGANNFTTTGTVFGNTIDRSTVGALLIGSTASSTSICNSTACDTIQLGTNADADTITIGDTSNLDAITVNGTLTNTNGSGSNSVINLSSTGDFIIQDNGTAFATFNDSGNVGIGTAPTYKFDVLNATTAQTATNRVANFSNAGATFNTTAGALSSYAGYFSSTSTRSTGSNALTNVGLYATASGAQNNYAAIFDQGNVGIGTTTPTDKFQIYSSTNTADLLKVQESGAINTNANTYGVTIMGKNTYLSANYPVLAIGDTSQATAFGIALEAKNGVYNIPTIQLGFSSSGGALDMWNYRSWQPDSTYGMKFTTKASGNAATDRITIGGNADTVDVLFKNSNVGIGATAASSKLDVTTNSLGTTQTTSSGLALVNTTAAGAGAQQISPAIRWTGQGWKTNATAASQSLDFRSYLVPVQGTANPSGYLTFESAVNGGSFSNIFTVDSSGKIGVGGITAPTNTLSVNGTGYVSGWFGISTTSQYNSSDFTIGDASDQDLWMAFRGKKADNSEIRLVMGTQGNVGVGNDNAFIGTATGDKLEFRTNNSGRITILGGGNVGIANGNPSYALHVGTSSISGIVARFENSTGTCDINPTTTSLSCSSDMRLKKNITKLDSQDESFTLNTELTTSEDTILAKVLALTPVTYNWNSENDSDPTHVGFIAQEVEQVFPDLVTTDGQGRKSLNYIGLVPYTIKAVQEMNIRVAALPEFEDQTMAQKVADFLRGIAERGEAVISSIKAQRVHTEELCVGSEGDEVCVTKDQLQNLLNNTSASAGGTPTAPEPTPTPDQGTDTGTNGDNTATDDAGTADTGTTETPTDTTSTDTTTTDTSSTQAADTGSSSDTSSI